MVRRRVFIRLEGRRDECIEGVMCLSMNGHAKNKRE
jgi:hypothetical protein